MTTEPKFLYGLPEAERLYDSPAAVWECEIEPHFNPDTEEGQWAVEKWTVRDPITHLPTVDQVCDWLTDFLADEVADGEIDEACVDHFADAIDAHVKARRGLFDVMLKAIAARVTYRMAGAKVGEHVITSDQDGLKIDGQPMYRKAS